MKTRFLLLSLVLGLTRWAGAGDLIAYWDFDTVGTGRSVDVQAGNVGLLLNGAQYTTAGLGRSGSASDRAMLFGNGAHRMYVPDATFLNAAGAANTITIAFWQNLGEQRDQITFSADTPTAQRALGSHTPWSNGIMYWDTGDIDSCCDPVENRIEAAPGIQWLSAWHHIVLVKNGDTKRIYLDGTELINGVNTAPLPTDFVDFYIGNGPTAANAVSGLLDDFAVFRRELTPEEVTSLAEGASPASLEPDNDTDSDLFPDAWELRFAPDLTLLAPGGDADSDGLLDEAELALGTNPNDNDTDGDGAPDGSETQTGVWVSSSDRGTSPFAPDTDGDTLLDGVETNTGTFVSAADTGTSPLSTDSDGDGAPDDFEVAQGTDPTDPADFSDTGWIVRNARSRGTLNSIASVRSLFGPGGNILVQTTTLEPVINFRENANGPFQPQAAFPVIGVQDGDTNSYAIRATGSIAITTAGTYTFGFSSDDGGGIYIDGQPVIVADVDRGTTTSLGAVNLSVGAHQVEFLYWENGGGAQVQVFAANTIGDFTLSGTDDATILANYHLLETSVFNASDSDGDGLPDAYEESFFPGDLTQLGLGDFDGDTVNDPDEFNNGTNPTLTDTDMDGLTEGEEVTAGTNPLNADTDGDGLLDGVEDNTGTFVSASQTGTDPLSGDSDGDKWNDGVEVSWPSDPTSAASFPSLIPDQLNLLAYWDFNDASVPTSAVDCIRGFNAEFFGVAAYSADAGGFLGVPGDRAMDLGTAGGSNGARVNNAKWFGLGIPPDKVITNLGSVGSDGDMFLGGAVPDAPGALAGSANTAITHTAPANTTRVPFLAALNPPGSWSAEAWLKPAAAMNPGQLLCALSSGDFADPRKGWLIYQSDAGWNLRTYYNDGISTAVNITGNNGAPPVPGVWTHVVVTWDGSVGRVFVDGVLRIASDPRPYVPGIAGGFQVGARADGPFQWSGDVDEVAFYGTALSEAEVAAHYANGNDPAPAAPYDALVLASNPLGYWRMTDSNPGPVQPDQAAISFWQNLSAISNSSAFWVSSPSSNNAERGFQAHVPWSDGNIYFDTAGCCDPPQRLSGPSGAVPGQWEHYVFQKLGDHKEVWRNGQLLLSGDFAARLPNDFTRLTIGADHNGVNATQGLIDDFAVFGNVLTPDEIGRLAGGESPKSVGAPPTPLIFTDIQVDSPATMVTLTWNSRPGRLYILESSLVLEAGTWTELDDSINSGGVTTTVVDNLLLRFPGGAPPMVYYRVREGQ